MIVALAGGVGGAKLAYGLERTMGARLRVVVNTGDDFEHVGLPVCPDLDTVCYTLAGLADRERGWGRKGESWHFMEALADLGGPEWFRLGDADLALHVWRSHCMAQGMTLTQFTQQLCRRFGIEAAIYPMSDDPVRTRVATATEGTLAFQDYFVRAQCKPAVTGFSFDGAVTARAQPDVLAALADPQLGAVIVCPSNPWVSIGPITAIEAYRQAIGRVRCPVIAVSPIVGGRALKGPAAKMMRELGLEASALTVAQHYRGLVRGMVIDLRDAHLAAPIEALGLRVKVCKTVMTNDHDRVRLAADILDWTQAWD